MQLIYTTAEMAAAGAFIEKMIASIYPDASYDKAELEKAKADGKLVEHYASQMDFAAAIDGQLVISVPEEHLVHVYSILTDNADEIVDIVKAVMALGKAMKIVKKSLGVKLGAAYSDLQHAATDWKKVRNVMKPSVD